MERRPFINTVERLARVTAETRAEAGITPAELAERAGVDQDFVADIEAGRPRAEVGRAVRVLRALDMQPRAIPASSPHAFKADGTLKDEYAQDFDARGPAQRLRTRPSSPT